MFSGDGNLLNTHISSTDCANRFCVTVYTHWKRCDHNFPCQWNEACVRSMHEKNDLSTRTGIRHGDWTAVAWANLHTGRLRMDMSLALVWVEDFFKKRFPISFLVALSNPQLLANR